MYSSCNYQQCSTHNACMPSCHTAHSGHSGHGGYGGSMCGQPPACGGYVYKQVVHAPEPAPEYIIQRRRMPTPPPNVYEQTIVMKPRRQIIHEIVEQPCCPPPIVRRNYVMDQQKQPAYYTSTVPGAPRSNGCMEQQADMCGMGGMGGGCESSNYLSPYSCGGQMQAAPQMAAPPMMGQGANKCGQYSGEYAGVRRW